jgi:hypothetical protein
MRALVAQIDTAQDPLYTQASNGADSGEESAWPWRSSF